jgi:hypothetical protein
MDTSTPQETASWGAELEDHLKAHIETERQVLQEYAQAVAAIDAPDVRYLINLILEDEVRHHRIFGELANALQSAVGWAAVEPAVPPLGRHPLPPELRELPKRLIDIERDDARELRALAKAIRPVRNTTLWGLLVELMALDTRKHVRILSFLAQQDRRVRRQTGEHGDRAEPIDDVTITGREASS